MRLLVSLALILAVLVSLPSAVAVRSGKVYSRERVSVVSTNSALISLAPGSGSGNAAGTAYYRNGTTRDVLLLNFTRGLNAGTSYGFPPNSRADRDRFRYRELFTVTNRSDETLCIAIFVPGGGVTDLTGIYLRSVTDPGTGTPVAGGGGTQSGCATLAADGTFAVDFWWEIASGTEGLSSFQVRVEGSRP